MIGSVEKNLMWHIPKMGKLKHGLGRFGGWCHQKEKEKEKEKV